MFNWKKFLSRKFPAGLGTAVSIFILVFTKEKITPENINAVYALVAAGISYILGESVADVYRAKNTNFEVTAETAIDIEDEDS